MCDRQWGAERFAHRKWQRGRRRMFRTIMGLVLAAALVALVEPSRADDTKYPNWKGEWDFAGPRLPGQRVRFDPSKSPGRAQDAPLTPEYKKIHEDSMADQANGG